MSQPITNHPIRRQLRIALFRAIEDIKPEILESLRGKPYTLFQAIPPAAINYGWALFSESVAKDKMLKLLEARGFASADASRFLEALSSWQKDNKVARLGEWTLPFAYFVMFDWRFFPEEPLGYSWQQFKGFPIPYDEANPPPKFIFTLAIPSQSVYEDLWDQREAEYRAAAKREGATYIEKPFNPYAVTSSEYIPMHNRSASAEEGFRDIWDGVPLDPPDWDIRTGESREQAYKRIRKIFDRHLRTHLQRVKSHAGHAGWPTKETKLEFPLRDAKFVVTRYLDGLTYPAIAKTFATTERTVSDAVREYVKLAMLPPYSKKK